MKLSKIVRLALTAFATVPAAAHAAGQPLLMTPSSDWTVDHAADSCALRRTFSGGEDTASLELRQFMPGDSFDITIGSDTLWRTRGAPHIRHRPDEDWLDPPRPSFLGNGDWHGVRFNDSLRPAPSMPSGEAWPAWPDEDRDAREAAVTELAVAGSFERQLTLQTGGMHAPMEAMRACLRELITHWGLDSSVQETLSRRVQPIEQRTWAQQIFDEYPVDMLRQGKSGRVQIRLMVGIDGKPTNCVAIKGPAEPSFETAACASTMRYSRFEPALDAQGQPVASYWGSTLVYETRR
jgi:hypothetical protein